MAYCSSLTDIEKFCGTNRGSLVELKVLDMTEITATTINAAGILTAVTATATTINLAFGRDKANYTAEQVTDEASDGVSYNLTVNCTIAKRDSTKRASILLLAEGRRELAIFGKDGNGYWWYFPNMVLITNTGGSGESRGVGSMYQLSFNTNSDTLEIPTTQAVVTSLA